MVYNCNNSDSSFAHAQTVKYFCEHIDYIDSTLTSNLTSTSKKLLEIYLNGLCCANEVLTSMCESYPFANYTFKIKCLPNDLQENFDLQTYILMAVLLPLGVLGNLLILYAIRRYKCIPTQTGYFLCSLAASDLGVILESVALLFYHKDDAEVSERVHTYLFPSFDMFFAAVSLLHITVISVERAIAVTWPFKYPSIISSKRAKHLVQCIWLLSTFIMISGLLRIPVHSYVYGMTVFFVAVTLLLLTPIVVITISYSFVVVSAYQNLRQDRKRLRMLSSLVREKDRGVKTKCHKKISWKLNSVRCKEIKLSMNVAMIVVPFLVCWGFFMFAHLYESFSSYTFTGPYDWLLFNLPFMVSNLNPILYLFLTRSLRKAVKSMVCRVVAKTKPLNKYELSPVTLTSLHNGTNSLANSVSVLNSNSRMLQHLQGQMSESGELLAESLAATQLSSEVDTQI